MSEKKEYTFMKLSTAVFITFLVMKLAKIGEVANWSWWWVTCPLWISLAISLALILIVFLFGGAYIAYTDRKDRKRIDRLRNMPGKISRFQERLNEMEAKRKQSNP